ncbi:hypothetical protein [Amycolatopsis sp. CA-230715]|uniref:hypothetical protein n=1 Tax=Amycolatopsis sp. CA-230715 TaxID=2745196 RepID=UPI001C01C092|nr:hypothetical protein [Amycolatopsis sp. CA-230715]
MAAYIARDNIDFGPFTTNRRHARAAIVLATVSVALLTGCSTPGPSPPGALLTPPPPGQSGPRIDVAGQAVWRTERLGCAVMTTTAGQRLRLLGDATIIRERAVATGAAAAGFARLTGCLVTPPEIVTVCDGIPFAVERIHGTSS